MPSGQQTRTGPRGMLFFEVPLSLKSTWFVYYALAYVSTTGPVQSAAYFADRTQNSPWEKGRRLLAALFLLSFLFATVAHNFIFTSVALPASVAFPLEYFFVLDFQIWKKPWQICNLVSAAATFYIFALAKDIAIDVKYPEASADRKVRIAKITHRVRNLFSFGLAILMGIHAFILFGPQQIVPAVFWPILSMIYGEFLPPH